MMNLHHHLNLLLRWERGLTLRHLVQQLVTPTSRVLDAGCGSGLLSLWAAQLGAAEVIGADLAETAVAKALAQENGLADRVRFLRCDIAALTPEQLGGRVDILLAMLYWNDQRRDEATARLVAALKSRVLAPDGHVIPDRVEYTCCPYDWPAQDLRRRDATWRQTHLPTLSDRYGLSFASLYDAAINQPDPAWFPRRQPSGLLEREGALPLSPEVPLATIDYQAGPLDYPATVSFPIAVAGNCSCVVWTQRLYFQKTLIFANESLSWLVPPQPVRPGQTLTLPLDDAWRASNRLTALPELTQ